MRSLTCRSPLLAMLLLGGAAVEPSYGQGPIGPPVGGPSGNFIGPPTGTPQDFLGAWNVTWQGPIDAHCPCRGTLTIDFEQTANGAGMVGYWAMKGSQVVLHGSVSYNQTIWTGRFAVPDDTADFPFKGYFRLETRGNGNFTGSYQRDGTAIPYAWNGSR
jgi:hypothetical protein